MVEKLAIRSLRRGIGSMDYIHTLLREDDLYDDDGGKTMDAFNDLVPHSIICTKIKNT